MNTFNLHPSKTNEDLRQYAEFLKTKPVSNCTIYKKGKCNYVSYREYVVNTITIQGLTSYSWGYIDRQCNIKANGELGANYTNDFYNRVDYDLVRKAIAEWIAIGKPEIFRYATKEKSV